MFTIAAGAAGLNSASLREFPGVVDPPAKAHSDANVDAHGAVLQPSGPDTAWLATTPRRRRRTTRRCSPGAVPPTGSPRACSGGDQHLPADRRNGPPARRRSDAGHDTGTGCAVELVRYTVVAAAPPVPAGQKADEEEASAGGTGTASARAPGRRRERHRGRRCRSRPPRPAPRRRPSRPRPEAGAWRHDAGTGFGGLRGGLGDGHVTLPASAGCCPTAPVSAPAGGPSGRSRPGAARPDPPPRPSQAAAGHHRDRRQPEDDGEESGAA